MNKNSFFSRHAMLVLYVDIFLAYKFHLIVNQYYNLKESFNTQNIQFELKNVNKRWNFDLIHL